ncbi:MAG: LEA type 2 family protein [Gemmatimonadota bacterium]
MHQTAGRTGTLALLLGLGAAAAGSLTGCATLGQVVQAPIFELAQDRDSRVRLVGPSLARPLGGAELQVWARVENPNPVGFTLSRLTGTVLLSEQRAADVDLPLGLPLEAAQDTVIPLSLTLSFADIPELADRLGDALSRGTIEYALRGTLAVDAGPFGQPSFGPRTWLQGDVSVIR